MDKSDGMDKPWDHPWTTEEMRNKRREWSLAGDAGLLKHLQQFSENLVSKAKKTQEELDSLTTQLSETEILINNVTNTSLALANTQFIESRVQEDDVEMEKKVDYAKPDSKDQDLETANLIASVSESVRQGLSIMDEKYRQMEVVDSDSEEDDNAIVLSVILGPNNPYQDRPLPYVIGSDKWKNSNKIGLESSSSESGSENSSSEQVDEDDDNGIFDMNATSKINIDRLSSLSESDNYNHRNDITYLPNDKMDSVCQNNMNSVPESITPIDNIPKAPLANNGTPNFAEELAKRLGTVRQAQKPIAVDESNEASINRYKDDLFTPEEDDSMFSNKSENIFSGNKEMLNHKSSDNLWKEKPIKPFKTNIIPASIDVPPPISTVSTKPKSAIDDLFADVDANSDTDADSEDSDNIFSSKKNVKKISKDKNVYSSANAVSAANIHKKYLDITAPATTKNIATSTPEMNTNTTNLFSDEEEDPTPIKKVHAEKKLPAHGNVLESEGENKLTNRIPRVQSYGSQSSVSDVPGNSENRTNEESVRETSRNVISNDNVNNRSSILAPVNNTENLTGTDESSRTSGVSIHPSSINNTEGSSIGVDFQPQMTSTRLKSEDIYRERIVSDSLFAARTRNASSISNSNSNSMNNQQRVEERNNITTSLQQDDVFLNEDLFGPPPLPKADSKPQKAKVSTLFDDSDSGDELFSTTSSGSRSQKSTDFLATTPQYSQHIDRAKSTQRRGLFDEDIDIFGTKDSPDVDIFRAASKPTFKEESNSSAGKLPAISIDGLFSNSSRDSTKDKVGNAGHSKSKKISLFDDDEEDTNDGILFSTNLIKSDSTKESRIFEDHDGDDLFPTKKLFDNKEATNDNRQSADSIKPRMDKISENLSSSKPQMMVGGDIPSGNGIFSSIVGARGLVFEDEDYDDLFGNKITTTEKEEHQNKPILESKKDVQSKGPVVENFEVSSVPCPSTSKVGDSVAVEEINVVSERQTRGQINEKDIASAGVTAENNNITGEIENETKKSPPRSLNIRAAASSPPPLDENSQAARRTVSGKIKNLMGKMGDFKILSPMDTPPLWRRSEERADEEDIIGDKDSDDGGCISIQGHSSPPSISEDSTAKQSLQSNISGGSNVESAISFDEPAQVETLSTAASKTRVRIQAKRRPQSRHARKSALRQSGIDFDAVDTSGGNSQDESHSGELTNSRGKETGNFTHSVANHLVATHSDRLAPLASDNIHKTADLNFSLATDDKSDLGSLSKESSMSANKNTLLSPSTDEEDLFDVPPDLPEDPQKEDALFGRAPILSPVDKVLAEKMSGHVKPLKDTYIKGTDITEKSTTDMEDNTIAYNDINRRNTLINLKDEPKKEVATQPVTEPQGKQDTSSSKNAEPSLSDASNEEPVDPLRDSTHDPLKDPSQLFAFVTKTPSPEKGKNLLFSEDDSLFASGFKKSREEQSAQKAALDLFFDEPDGDLFSGSLSKHSKSGKKPLKDTTISLFNDDGQDENDSLFGSVTKQSAIKTEVKKLPAAQHSQKKTSLFGDDDNDINLFIDQTEQSQKSESAEVAVRESKNEISSGTSETVKTSHITDIFGEQSSGDDDIFTMKSAPKKVIPSNALFPSDEEGDSHIFGKASSATETKVKPLETRSTIKKAITKDLKKTAEKIGDDPLSILQDD